MAAPPAPKPKRHQLGKLFADADLVDRIFAFILAEFPEIDRSNLREAELAIREEFGGNPDNYVRTAHALRRRQLAHQVLALFNGRNASEVAQRLGISRPTVYRILKQPGGQPAVVQQTETVSVLPKT